MQVLYQPKFVRIIVPVLIVLGFLLYHLGDSESAYVQSNRWPSSICWMCALLIALAYQMRYWQRIKRVVYVALALFLTAMTVFLGAMFGAHGWTSVLWILYVAIPVAILAGLVFLTSLYI